MKAAKLTLRLDKQVIERGKEYAAAKGTSLSKMFEHFINEITPPAIDQKLRTPDPSLKELFAPRPAGSFEMKSNYELRDEYYTAILNRTQTEEE